MASKSRKKNTFLNLVTGLGGHLFTTMLDFVVRTVFIHTLGAQYLGINGLFSNILSMLSLANLGIGTAIVFRMYKPLAVNDEQRVRVLLKFYKLAYRLIGTLIFIVGLALIPFLKYLIKDYSSLGEKGINATILFLLFLFNSASSYWFLAYRITVLSANQESYIVTIIGFVSHIVTCIAKILILVFVKDFMLYTGVTILIGIVFTLIQGLAATKRYPQYFIKEKESISKQEVKEMLSDCGALFVYKVNAVVVKASDNMILSAMSGLSMVGLYSNYLLFYSTCVGLFGWILASYKASLGNLYATMGNEVKHRFFIITFFLVAVVFGTAAVGISVCSNEVISVWIGSEYVIPQPMPILIGIELFLVGILDNLGQVRHISGVFRQAWFRPILSIIVNIVSSILFAKIWGIYGVVCGTITTWLTTNFLVDPHLVYKYTFNSQYRVREFYSKSLLYMVILSAITALDMLFCNHVFTGHGWFSVAVHVLFTGISVPAVFALLFWKTDECRYLVNMVRGALGKVFHKRKKLDKPAE